jgi:hypothetical protein
VAVFALADALGFGYDGFGLVQFLGVVAGLIVVAFGGLLLRRRPWVSRFGRRSVYRMLVAALFVLTVTVSSVVLWGIWERARELSEDQIAWCDSHAVEMYDAAVELELVTRDEVVDLILNMPRIGSDFISAGPEPTREEWLRLFETDPDLMRGIAAAVWSRGGVEPGDEAYKTACKEAYANAPADSIEGFVAPPGDTVNCDFDSAAEAQEWYDNYFPRYGDVARLDGDEDGVPCEDAGWHIDFNLGLAPDDLIHGVEWGPDSGFSDMKSGDSCASGGSWVPPGPDFPFTDINRTMIATPMVLVRFDVAAPLSPRGAWVHLADGSCLPPDLEGSVDGTGFYQFDSTLPQFDGTVP